MKLIGIFLVSGLTVGSLYALGGIGLVVLKRATGVLNFAYGAIAAASAMLCWQLIQWSVYDALAWLAAIGLGILLSVFYGRFIAPKLAWREPIVKTVATLGFALVILGTVSFIWNDMPRKLTLPTDKIGFRLFEVRITVTRLIVFFSSISIVIAMVLYLEKTRIGLYMRSLSNNRQVSGMLGIPIIKVETIAWMLSGALSGFTGLIYGDLVRLDPTLITFLVIPAIAAAICGRLESLPMTFVGGLLIGVMEALLTLVKPLAPLRAMSPFIVAIAILLWTQRGRKLTFSGGD